MKPNEESIDRLLEDILSLHLSNEELDQWHSGLITRPSIKQRFQAHLDRCVYCSTRLEVLARFAEETKPQTLDDLDPETREIVARVLGKSPASPSDNETAPAGELRLVPMPDKLEGNETDNAKKHVLRLAAQDKPQAGWGEPVHLPCQGTDKFISLIFELKGVSIFARLSAEPALGNVVLAGDTLEKEVHLAPGGAPRKVMALREADLRPGSTIDEIKAWAERSLTARVGE